MIVLNVFVRCQIFCLFWNIHRGSRAEYNILTCQLYRYSTTLLFHRSQRFYCNRLIWILITDSKAVTCCQISRFGYIIGICSVLQSIGSIFCCCHRFAFLHNKNRSSVRNRKCYFFGFCTTGDIDGVGTGSSLGRCIRNIQFIYSNLQRNSIFF